VLAGFGRTVNQDELEEGYKRARRVVGTFEDDTTSMDADTVLRSLRANVEFLEGDYGNVYLDNARPYGMSERTFRSCLSHLIKSGLYEPVDGFAWGRVRIE
jgi:hypothetical protein